MNHSSPFGVLYGKESPMAAKSPTNVEPGPPPERVPVRVIVSGKNWSVGDAVQQLQRVAQLPGVVMAVGMPDLHPGKGVPIGAAVATSGVLYPHLAGNDIGCGMALWQTDLLGRKLKLDRWVRKLDGLESPWEGDVAPLLVEAGIVATPFDGSLGTIGGGNHFAELQAIAEIQNPAALATLGVQEDRLLALVHSGSRGLGESILRDHVDRFGAGGLAEDSEEARQYLARHDHALTWATVNRGLIAKRFLAMLGAEGRPLVDLSHNSILPNTFQGQRCWLHRKGAAPSDAGPVVIPGSRGTLSYLVLPTGDQESSGWSVAHGAGRKWARTDARARLERQHSVESLQRTDLGGRVICEDKDLLFEEAPQAYKNIDQVIQDLVDSGLVEVVATLRPLITYKVRISRE